MMDAKLASMERQLLVDQHDTVLQDIAILREAMLGEVDVDVDEGDPDVIEREKSMALLAALEMRLASIEDALRSMDRGTYGVCERCGKAIPAERLEVKPDATLCLSCQVEVEKLQKRGMLPPRPRWGYDLEEPVVEEE